MHLLILTLAAVLGTTVGLSASNWGGSVHDDQQNRNLIGQSRFNEDSLGHDRMSSGGVRFFSDDDEGSQDFAKTLRMGAVDNGQLIGAASRLEIPYAVLQSLAG